MNQINKINQINQQTGLVPNVWTTDVLARQQSFPTACQQEEARYSGPLFRLDAAVID